jgi:hypothetical protein
VLPFVPVAEVAAVVNACAGQSERERGNKGKYVVGTHGDLRWMVDPWFDRPAPPEGLPAAWAGRRQSSYSVATHRGLRPAPPPSDDQRGRENALEVANATVVLVDLEDGRSFAWARMVMLDSGFMVFFLLRSMNCVVMNLNRPGAAHRRRV